jgi:dihydrofolate reductase
MRPVIYSMSVSMDGFIAGPDGDIGWAAPDPELMRFHNEQTREVAVHVCGRALYADMLPWETDWADQAGPAGREFAGIWRAIPKVVFSATLDHVEGNARLAAGSVADEIAQARSGAGAVPGGVVSVGGAGLAAALIQLDLIDEYRMFINPVVLGGGTPFFPPDAPRLDLELADLRRFGSRAYLGYRRARSSR